MYVQMYYLHYPVFANADNFCAPQAAILLNGKVCQESLPQ